MKKTKLELDDFSIGRDFNGNKQRKIILTWVDVLLLAIVQSAVCGIRYTMRHISPASPYGFLCDTSCNNKYQIQTIIFIPNLNCLPLWITKQINKKRKNNLDLLHVWHFCTPHFITNLNLKLQSSWKNDEKKIQNHQVFEKRI